MNEHEAREAARKWVGAWNDHDVEAVVAQCADDIELSSPFIATLYGESGGRLAGKEALRKYVGKCFGAFPDLRFEVFQVFAGVDGLAIYFSSVNGLLTAEMMNYDKDGKITHVNAHYRDPA